MGGDSGGERAMAQQVAVGVYSPVVGSDTCGGREVLLPEVAGGGQDGMLDGGGNGDRTPGAGAVEPGDGYVSAGDEDLETPQLDQLDEGMEEWEERGRRGGADCKGRGRADRSKKVLGAIGKEKKAPGRRRSSSTPPMGRRSEEEEE